MADTIARAVVRESTIHGLGVFAATEIPRGAPILRIDDSRVVTEDKPLREADGEYAHHCDYLAGGKVVLMRSPERYINHSCDPNSFVKTILGDRYVFALRTIASGEEITYDYCVNGHGDTLWDCVCSSERCRKLIHADLFHLPYALQVEYLPLLDSWYVDEYGEQVARMLAAAGVLKPSPHD